MYGRYSYENDYLGSHLILNFFRVDVLFSSQS